MNRSDLIKTLAESGLELPLNQVDEIVRNVFNAMEDALQKGENIEIRGFGTFGVRERKARVARNPKTGEPIQVSSKRYIHFKPGKELRGRMNPEKS